MLIRDLNGFIVELRKQIRKMTRKSKIYTVLRDELKEKDHWKMNKRGKPRTFTQVDTPS